MTKCDVPLIDVLQRVKDDLVWVQTGDNWMSLSTGERRTLEAAMRLIEDSIVAHNLSMGDESIRKDETGKAVLDDGLVPSPTLPSEISVVDEEFIIEHIWRLFDQFQSPTIGNRSPSAEASAKRKAKEVYERLLPYLRTTEPVSLEDVSKEVYWPIERDYPRLLMSDIRKLAKATLDAAGVKYVQ